GYRGLGFGAAGGRCGRGVVPGRGDGSGGGGDLGGRLGGAALARGAGGVRVRGVGRDLLPLVALRGLPGVARQPWKPRSAARRVAGGGRVPVHGPVVRLRPAAPVRVRAGDAARHLRLPPRRLPASRALGGGHFRPDGAVARRPDGRGLPRLGHGGQRRQPHLRGGTAGSRGGRGDRRGAHRLRALDLRRSSGCGDHPGRQGRPAAGLRDLRPHGAVGARRRRHRTVRRLALDDRGRRRGGRARPGRLAPQRTDLAPRPQGGAAEGRM
ncbi:MAG: hypothetical protein AVDCRST_MAG01-01-1052, partial [uncultured Rubrobacteraceae bacterium]